MVFLDKERTSNEIDELLEADNPLVFSLGVRPNRLILWFSKHELISFFKDCCRFGEGQTGTSGFGESASGLSAIGEEHSGNETVVRSACFSGRISS